MLGGIYRVWYLMKLDTSWSGQNIPGDGKMKQAEESTRLLINYDYCAYEMKFEGLLPGRVFAGKAQRFWTQLIYARPAQ